MLAGSLLVSLAASVATAAPASATCTNTVAVSASWTPTSVSVGAINTLHNKVTLTNCTSSTQTVAFSGTVTAPSGCGGTVFNFGPISETLTAGQVFTFDQIVEQAPSCAGTYTQVVNVKQGGVTLSSATASFTAI
jgi:hypothetical protein